MLQGGCPNYPIVAKVPTVPSVRKYSVQKRLVQVDGYRIIGCEWKCKKMGSEWSVHIIIA